MATNNGKEPTFSVAEVVGISAAAAAALGGVIVALGRAQANSQQTPAAVQKLPSREEIAQRAHKGRALAASAAESASSHYPEARERASATADRAAEMARTYGAEVSGLAETGIQRAQQQSKVLSERIQESILPAVTAGAIKVRKSIEQQAKQTDTDELLERSRHLADDAAQQLRQAGASVSKTFQKDVLPAVTPVVKDATERAEEFVEQLKHRAEDSKGRKGSLPGTKAVASGKESAQHAVQTTTKAASDSLSTLMWLLVSSAIIYLVMLSPERREKVKSAAYNAIDQIKLLIGDFKGYETEF